MTRLISQDEMQEGRLKCKKCHLHIAFRSDIDLEHSTDYDYVICPNCTHHNIIKYSNIDPRNVIDEYKNLPNEEIKRRLKEKAFPFAVLFEHLQYDMNIGGIFRSANGFGAKEIYYIGQKRINRKGMAGIQNYSDITYLPTINDLVALKSKYKIIAVDNVGDATPIDDFEYPTNSLLCFGSEADGLSKELLNIADIQIYIPMSGSVRSLNVSVAAGIIMHDYTRKHK